MRPSVHIIVSSAALNSLATLLYEKLQWTTRDEDARTRFQRSLEIEGLWHEALELATQVEDTTNLLLLFSNLANYYEIGIEGINHEGVKLSVDHEAAARYRVQLQACMRKIGRNDLAEEYASHFCRLPL